MKLFSFAENDNKKQAEVARDVARTEQVRDALVTAQKELSHQEALFDLAMANQRKFSAEEEEKYLVKINGLQEEVRVLEGRKKEALIPIDEQNKKAYDNLKLSEEKLNEAEATRKKNDEITELLNDKIDEYGEKISGLESREKKVYVREKSAQEQSGQLKSLTENLSLQWTQLHLAVVEHDKNVAATKKAHDVRESDLIAREQAFAKNTIAARLEISKEKALIQDREETLEREIQRQNGKPQRTT